MRSERPLQLWPARPPKIRWRLFLRSLGLGAVLAIALGGAGVALARRVTLNVTGSMPRGLYWLPRTRTIERGTSVTLAVPKLVRPLVAERRYLPASFGLLKRVVALAADHVCLTGQRYVVGDEVLSSIAPRDRLGRPLTSYSFCGAVPAGMAFLVGRGESSLDSRYFGPIPLGDLTPVVPLWTFF